MDYKELIEQLRDEGNCDVLDYIEDAAAAIETLLAEREAEDKKKTRSRCSELARRLSLFKLRRKHRLHKQLL